MSNNTKSGYTKTGKKVKSIYDGRVDLTYNWVYDVFIDNKGDEFIIDDIGDKRYWSIYDDDYYELVDDTVDTTNDIRDTNETKLKFKVGDKVKVVDDNYISVFTDNVKVGYTGIINLVDNYDNSIPYRVKFDELGLQNEWWFTDKCIELVGDDNNTIENENSPIKSDGMVDKVNETKPKFKVGDKVMVVNTDYISAYDAGVRVGDIGTVIESGVDKYHVKFEGTSYDCDWWFTDKCIELVSEDNDTIENNPIKSDGSQIVSDGGSSSYYAQQIPKGMLERFNTTGTIEAKDVIRLFLGNDFNMGNIFKAYCRIISLRNGKGKAGIDEQYDLTKVKYFAEDELNYYLENKDV